MSTELIIMSVAQAKFVRDMITEIWGAAQVEDILAGAIARRGFADRMATKRSINDLIAKRDAVRADRRAAGIVAGAATREATVAKFELAHNDCLTGETYGVARVVKAQAGHLYATKMEGEGASADYVYWPGGLDRVGADPTTRKLTFAEALALSAARGKCCRCNRKLKANKSVEAGIGPVCKSYFDM